MSGPWRAAMAALAVALSLAGEGRGAPDAPPAADRDVLLAFEGALVDREADREVVALSFEVPAVEWRDRAGAWRLETAAGTGRLRVLQPDGSWRSLSASVRMATYRTHLLARRGKGHVHSLRGDLHVIAGGLPVELELGGRALIPPPGAAWSVEPLPARPESPWDEALRLMQELPASGRGGGLLLSWPGPHWGRPAGAAPLMGWLRLVRVEVEASERSVTERDADRLLARLQYVGADYALAVSEGRVVSEAEYGEQLRLLDEARRIADALPVGASVEEALDRLRRRVTWMESPETVAAAARAVAAEVALALAPWLPSPGGASGPRASALFGEACAGCHGSSGAGDGPNGPDLDPPPRDLTDPSVLAGMSPLRAYAAITRGLPGTGMPSFEDALVASDRWSLAFHAFSFGHGAGDPEVAAALHAAGVAPTLETLALATDDELRAMVEAARAPVAPPAALAALRGPLTRTAAASPLLGVRSRIRALVRSEDPGSAAALLDRVRDELAPGLRGLRRLDPASAAQLERGIEGLATALGGEAGGRAEAARRLLAATGAAEVSSRRAAPAGGPWWPPGTPVAPASLFAAAALLLAAVLGLSVVRPSRG